MRYFLRLAEITAPRWLRLSFSSLMVHLTIANLRNCINDFGVGVKSHYSIVKQRDWCSSFGVHTNPTSSPLKAKLSVSQSKPSPSLQIYPTIHGGMLRV